MLKAQRKIVLRTRVAEMQTEAIEDVVSAIVQDGKAESLKTLEEQKETQIEETKITVPEKAEKEVQTDPVEIKSLDSLEGE